MYRGQILKVYWHPHARHSERAVWNIVQTEFGSFEEAVAVLETGRLITAEVLITKRDPSSETFLVIATETCVFRGSAVERFDVVETDYDWMGVET